MSAKLTNKKQIHTGSTENEQISASHPGKNQFHPTKRDNGFAL